jgi:para-nitrobenzyl esterase
MIDPVVRTRAGDVRGIASAGIETFLGVPYAAAPVGERRFRVPQPVPRWDGVRAAQVPGANAPQIIRAFPGLDVTPLVGDGWRRGDDFLTANICTPDAAARGLPVMVFIHGGAFVGGSSDAPVHAGAEFARSGIVYVAINYRLGVEGFLPIPGVPTNLGLRDQIAALHWVQDNIAAFGGDASNVTVAGESAGAMSIADLMVSPLVEGLFRRAMVQSGHGSMVRPVEVAMRVVEAAASHLRVSADAEGFQRCSLEQCALAVDTVSRPEVHVDLRDVEGRDAAYGLSRFLPVYGDDVLPEPPLTALRSGAAAQIDMLIGTNREEMNIYLVPTGVRQNIDARSAGALLGALAPRAQEILSAYGLQHAPRAGDALTTALTDLVFRLPARQFAAAHQGRTHLYEFGWRSPACNGELGACHALELPFVFKSLDTCRGPQGIAGMDPPEDVAQRVHQVWVDAVTHGEFPWPEYDAETRQCLALETGEVARDAMMPAAALI